MNATYQDTSTTWLRTDSPVVSVNALLCAHVPIVAAALHRGVLADVDATRAGFYEMEICGHWYYVHIASRTERVYLIAARSESALK